MDLIVIADDLGYSLFPSKDQLIILGTIPSEIKPSLIASKMVSSEDPHYSYIFASLLHYDMISFFHHRSMDIVQKRLFNRQKRSVSRLDSI